MSRSVRTDYSKLILRKLGMTVTLTDEQLFWLMADTDPAYERKAEPYVVAPTNEDWAKYHRAKAGLLALQNYEGTWGLSEVEVPIPTPETHYKYTETHEQWLERCRALQAERNAA